MAIKFFPGRVETLPLHISSFDADLTGAMQMAAQDISMNSVAARAWRTNNLALYIPFAIPWHYPIKRVFVSNGTVSGNFDVGIYRADLTKFASIGSTAQSGASVIQYVSVDWLLPAGSYFMAMSCSTTSAQFQATLFSDTYDGGFSGMWQQATALPLPSSITPASNSGTYWPHFGFTRTASGF